MRPLHVCLRHSLTVAAENRVNRKEALEMKNVAGRDVDDGDFGAPFFGGGGAKGEPRRGSNGGERRWFESVVWRCVRRVDAFLN